MLEYYVRLSNVEAKKKGLKCGGGWYKVYLPSKIPAVNEYLTKSENIEEYARQRLKPENFVGHTINFDEFLKNASTEEAIELIDNQTEFQL